MAKLNAAKRNKLPTDVFGLPETRAYPLDTAARSRSALSRASANATPSQQKQIRAKVHRLYPDIHQGGSGKMKSLSSMAA
jgi:hypothetical protein